jgi:hypothetical protein
MNKPDSAGRIRLLVTVALVAGLSYWLGERGTFRQTPTSSPLARVGFALEQPTLQGSARDWRALERDLRQLRAMVDGDERAAFDLVLALRGLLHEGRPNWERAQQLCTTLKWPRCDREALEAIERRTHP